MDSSVGLYDESRSWRLAPVSYEVVLHPHLAGEARWIYVVAVCISVRTGNARIRASRSRWEEVTGLGWRRLAAGFNDLEHAGLIKIKHNAGQPSDVTLLSTEKWEPGQREAKKEPGKGARREDQLMFDDLCSFMNVSPSKISPQMRGTYNKKIKEWRDAGFTATNMNTALSLWHEDWRYQNNPNTGISYSEIGKFLAQAASGVVPRAEADTRQDEELLRFLNG